MKVLKALNNTISQNMDTFFAITDTESLFQHLIMKNNFWEQILSEMYWAPVIERADIPNAYLTKLPHQSLQTGDIQKIPVLIGITSEESVGN